MSKTIPVPIERLADCIMQYLVSHPHAADTVAGIKNWWLSGAAAGRSDNDVETAVRVLVQRGMLECRTLPDGVRIYARSERV